MKKTLTYNDIPSERADLANAELETQESHEISRRGLAKSPLGKAILVMTMLAAMVAAKPAEAKDSDQDQLAKVEAEIKRLEEVKASLEAERQKDLRKEIRSVERIAESQQDQLQKEVDDLLDLFKGVALYVRDAKHTDDKGYVGVYYLGKRRVIHLCDVKAAGEHTDNILDTVSRNLVKNDVDYHSEFELSIDTGANELMQKWGWRWNGKHNQNIVTGKSGNIMRLGVNTKSVDFKAMDGGILVMDTVMQDGRRCIIQFQDGVVLGSPVVINPN
jgi:cell division protein FtsB